MTLPTVTVTCTASDQNGNPVAGAKFEARLDRTETYQGFVVPEKVDGIADEAGVCLLQLWPNALGVAGSSYLVRATNPDTGKRFLNTNAVVPNSACNLHEILVQEPYPPIDAAQQALIAAQGALALVTEQAGIATDAAEATAADRIQTGQDAQATNADRTQTGLDRQATAADRIATGQDRVQTGQDRTATGADRLQTGLDRIATGQDRVQTGQDAQATAADRIATGQDRQATAADRIATGQDAAATDADRTQTELDRAQTLLDRQATAADRLQTGLDRQATAAAQLDIQTNWGDKLAAADAAADLAVSNAALTDADRIAAAQSAADADADRIAAEAARDAAFVNADVYADTTAGLAATTNGQQFQVVAGGEIIRYRRDSASVATEVARYPSAAAFDAVYREQFLAVKANYLANGIDRPNQLKRAAILVLVGQSNNTPRGAPISGSVSSDVLMPVGGNSMTYWPYNSTNAEWVAKYSDVASAITDAQGAAENPGSGAALAMLGGTFSRIYMCSVALGSSSFTRLQSTGPIANCNAVISRLCDIARADGFEPYVVFDTHHGETGASNGDSEATYYSQGWTYYRQIQAFAAHAMRRTDYDAPILFHMPVAYGTFGTAPNMRNVAKAIVRLARDIPGGIMLGGSYQFPITDGVHQSNVGMRKKGELAGQLLRDYFSQRGTFQALQMVDAVWSGATATVTFNKEIVYDTTLTFGTSLNATNALGGFEFTDDGAFIKINAISVQGRKAVLTLNAAPAGTTKLVQIASQAMTGSPTTFQLTAGSQIRANATAPLSIYDYTTPFYDMAAPQVLQVRP